MNFPFGKPLLSIVYPLLLQGSQLRATRLSQQGEQEADPCFQQKPCRPFGDLLSSRLKGKRLKLLGRSNLFEAETHTWLIQLGFFPFTYKNTHSLDYKTESTGTGCFRLNRHNFYMLTLEANIQSNFDIVKSSVALKVFTLSKHMLKVLCSKKSVLIEKVIYYIKGNLLHRSSTVLITSHSIFLMKPS